MPAPVMVVYDEAETRRAIFNALWEAGFEAAAFADPKDALDVVKRGRSRVRALVSQVSFGPGKLNGIVLCRMVRLRLIRPIFAVFIGPADYRRDAEQEGSFLLQPLDTQELVKAVRDLLGSRS